MSLFPFQRLWAELEQRKIELINVRSERDKLVKTIEEKEAALKKQEKDWEGKLRASEKDVNKDDGRDRQLNVDLAKLREKLESRDNLLKSQETIIETLKSELAKTREALSERKDALKDLKNELLKKNFDIQDFITKELLGRNNEVKELQDKLCNLQQGQHNPLEILKLLLQANPVRYDPDGEPSKDQQQVQLRSNSLSKLDAEPSEQRKDSTSQHSPRPARSGSFSLLENAFYAHMGQKVYNTNQTFNTYILPGEAGQETRIADQLPPVETASGTSTEPQKKEVDNLKESNPTKAFQPTIFDEEVADDNSLPIQTPSSFRDQSEAVPEKCSSSQPMSLSENTLHLLFQEVNTIRTEAQALKRDREILTKKVSALQMLNEQLSSKVSDSDPSYEKPSMPIPSKAIPPQKSLASDFKGQVETLKTELKGIQRKVTLQMLQIASSKYQESLKNYKQEIISLRKRLADSHNACDLLRNRLEELVDFMEQVLDMDRKGIINLSHLSLAQRASLQKSLDDSRSLSHSLSHSLMIGTDSLLGDVLSSLNDEEASKFCVPLDNLPAEISLTEANLGNSCDLSLMDASSNDMMYHSFAAKIVSQVENKSQEIDEVVAKLTHFVGVLEEKEEQYRRQMEDVGILRNQNVKLEEELKAKDRLLTEMASSHNQQLAGSASVGDLEESDRSLHLSNLQHSIPSPVLDSRIYHGILASPAESCSSGALPPPPSTDVGPDSSRLPDRSSQHATLGSSYSTDLAIKSLLKLNEPSAFEIPRQKYRIALEQLTLPSSFTLASPSESEAWSEPDRNVSLARIGLETCNRVTAGHDRSLSRSRMTRSAPFTSESEGEGVPEEAKEGSAGIGTPSSKPKRRSDAAEVKRLSVKLKSVEQLNETLRAELRIYQALSHQFGVKEEEEDLSLSTTPSRQASLGGGRTPLGGLAREDHDTSVTVPPPVLQEIRSLRMKLEEAISNNDLLRDQLEAALSGYLSEETRSLSTKLAALHQELKVNQEKLLVAASAEEQLKYRIKESDNKVFELGERLAAYMTCNQRLEKKIDELNGELQGSRQRLAKTEEELRSSKEWVEKSRMRESKNYKLEVEIGALQAKLKSAQHSEKERERKIEEQKIYILGLEQAKADYEAKLAEQDSAINELCQSITNLQQENTKSSISDEIILRLQEALQKSEGRLLQVTKERFALVGEKARLQAQLASVTTHAKLLQREIQDFSFSDENSNSDSENKSLLYIQRLKNAQATILELQKGNELFQSEKQVMQKEMQQLQEELSALRSHLDHVLSRESVTASREVRELATLQMSYKSLEETHSSLQMKYEELFSEKTRLEDRLKDIQAREKDIEQLRKTLKENEIKKEEMTLQLEAERCLRENLQMQIKHLQSNSSLHNGNELSFFCFCVLLRRLRWLASVTSTLIIFVIFSLKQFSDFLMLE